MTVGHVFRYELLLLAIWYKLPDYYVKTLQQKGFSSTVIEVRKRRSMFVSPMFNKGEYLTLKILEILNIDAPHESTVQIGIR